ncbi:MAG TPA: 30S ribosomal protein S8 [Chloroflexi bacterium]|jgi:small subunit ribosomal protein S8|nr:30S ribosomal protein S8 [Chloroflexota bacterium]
MSVTDPIADMLTRIRNAVNVRQNYTLVPASRLKRAIAQVLKDEGYITRYEVVRDGKFPMIKVYLKYTEEREPVLTGLRRVSKPGCRVYAKRNEIPWTQAGLGTVILSTPRGVITDREARRLGVGGEILCEVW